MMSNLRSLCPMENFEETNFILETPVFVICVELAEKNLAHA